MSVKRWLLELQYLLEYLVLWPLVALIQRMSEARSRQLAISLSRMVYRILAFDRRWCLRNLELVYGDTLTPAQRTALAMKAFENVVLTRIESLRWTPEWMATHVFQEGYEAFLATAKGVRSQGNAMIVIGAHLGNFELLPAYSYVHRDGWEFSVIYRPQNNWRVERLLAGARARYTPHLLPRGQFNALSLLWDLREGKGFGMMVDINTLSKPVFVDFLGFWAASPTGPALMALETGSPVALAVSIRQPDGRHRLVFQPPFELIDTGDRQHDIAANTQQYMKAIESFVLAHPEQYNWLHPRWRYRPDGSFWTLDMPYAQMAAERIGSARLPFQAPPTELPAARAA